LELVCDGKIQLAPSSLSFNTDLAALVVNYLMLDTTHVEELIPFRHLRVRQTRCMCCCLYIIGFCHASAALRSTALYECGGLVARNHDHCQQVASLRRCHIKETFLSPLWLPALSHLDVSWTYMLTASRLLLLG
jgi:hypothetical protein